MKSFLKYFLFLFLLAVISIGIALFLKKPKEQTVEEEPVQPAGSSKEFPEVGESNRDEISLVVPAQPEQGSVSSNGEQDNFDLDEDQIESLIEEIKNNYALDNWVDVKAPFRWEMSVEGGTRKITITGQGFSADSNQVQIEEIETFLKAEGFHLDSANVESGVNVSIKGLQKENAVCLVIKTTSQEINQFGNEDQSAKFEMRCGLIK